VKKRDFAADLAYQIRVDFDLTYRTQVNLEADINQMLDCGMKKKDVKEVLLDIFENLAFVNRVPVIVPGKGLTTVQIVVPGEKLPKKKGIR
jgi:hypothetical protein